MLPKNRFVILEHQTLTGVHWDLMLENEGVLWTWRLDIPPSDIHHPVSAERIFDHPLKFLSYEGPVQNGTARVKRCDKGLLQYRQITSSAIACQLNGNLLKGAFVLQMEKAPRWILTPDVNDQ